MNDYIGLQYKWAANPDINVGFSDCFQLFCAIRRRLGMRDYAEQFQWAYNKYDEQSFSHGLMLRWLLQNTSKTTELKDGDVGITIDKAALATVALGRIFCIAPRGRSVSIECNESALSCAYWFRPK